ncbi:MAG: helicase, partial [Nitrososphaerota archaeon]|nr:helicase [Nitrososphaerota archaeon]
FRSDKTRIIYNETLELAGIPPEAHRYQVNGKSALEWLMDNNTGYGIRTDQDSGIVNNANEWSKEVGDDRYVVDLIKKLVTVSIGTVEITENLPKLGL